MEFSGEREREREIKMYLITDELSENGFSLTNVLSDLLVNPWLNSLLNETLSQTNHNHHNLGQAT